MQTVQQKTLSHRINIANVPENEAEFDKLAGEVGAQSREANKNVIYRGWLPEWRNAFLHGADAEKDGDVEKRQAIQGLEQLTGIERKTKVSKPEVKDETGKVTQELVEVWAETEDDYESRVYAELVSRGTHPSVEAAVAAYAAHAQAVADLIPFDPKRTERKSAGPKKTPKTYVEVAQEIVNALGGSIEAACAAFSKKTGITLTVQSLDALAKAVWDDQRAQKKKIASGYVTA